MTKNDTTAIIGSRCLVQARKLAQPGLPEAQLPRSMEYYSQRYMQEYERWKRSNSRTLESCQSVHEVVSHLSASKDMEQNSYRRVREAVLNVPGGIDELESNERVRNDFMLDAGRQALRSGELEIRDRPSLKHLITLSKSDGYPWGVVSVSWSRRFILGVLIEAGLVEEGEKDGMLRHIKCNELLAPNRYDDEGGLEIVCTAQDKLDAMNELLSEWDARHESDGGEREELLVYVGDSSTDLGCLTRATFGFYLNHDGLSANPAMQRVIDLGIKSTTIDELVESSQLAVPALKRDDAGSRIPTLCAVKSFDEIDQWASRAFQDLR